MEFPQLFWEAYARCNSQLELPVDLMKVPRYRNDVEGIKRSLNSSNCYSCYSCQKGQKITLCTQYRYIQCYVKRVQRLYYVETKDIHIFVHNFLNIQVIFNLKKVLES